MARLTKGHAKVADENLSEAINYVPPKKERYHSKCSPKKEGDAKAADENLAKDGNNVSPKRKGCHRGRLESDLG